MTADVASSEFARDLGLPSVSDSGSQCYPPRPFRPQGNVAAPVHLSEVLFPQKEANLLVHKGIFFYLTWMHQQAVGYYLCTRISHPKLPLKSMDFSLFGLGKSVDLFGHENIQPRKHLCKHLQQAQEINLKTHKAGSHFQTHYFLVWRVPVNDK